MKQNKVGLWSKYHICGRSSEGFSSSDHRGEEQHKVLAAFMLQLFGKFKFHRGGGFVCFCQQF